MAEYKLSNSLRVKIADAVVAHGLHAKRASIEETLLETLHMAHVRENKRAYEVAKEIGDKWFACGRFPAVVARAADSGEDALHFQVTSSFVAENGLLFLFENGGRGNLVQLTQLTDGDLARLKALVEERAECMKEEKIARRQAIAVLSTCNTSKQAREKWTEISSFLDAFAPPPAKPPANLPARLSDLNAVLDLPPDEKKKA